jgi:hypothetical protein
MIAIYVHVGQQGSADGTKALFNAINKADTVKPILLAVFVRDLLAGHARGKLVITVTGAG